MGRKPKVTVPGYKYSEDRLYNVWNSMLSRCYNKKNASYKNYGERGITVCDEWKNNFFSFKGWAISAGYDYNKPRSEQEIDRINNDGNYEPTNCRWTTARENNRNRRYLGRKKYNHRPHKPHKRYLNGVYWTINGQTKPMLEWCEEYNMQYQLVQYRIRKSGMTPYEALTTPKAHNNGRPRKTEGENY